MLQKLKTRVSCKLTYALLLCAVTTSQSYSQVRKVTSVKRTELKPLSYQQDQPIVKEDISISLDEISYLASLSAEKIEIYKIEKKNISTYANPTYVGKLEKLDNEYEKQKADREKIKNSSSVKNYSANQLKDPIEDYYKNLEYSNKKKEAISTILTKIEAYLTSKEKYKKKNYLLNEAQILADEYIMGIVISDFEKVPRGERAGIVKRTLRLYDDGKRTDDEDIIKYKAELQKIEIKEPKKPNELFVKEELLEQKSKKVNRVAYITNFKPINPTEFVGEFKIIDEKYVVCESNNFEYFQNELVDTPISACYYGRKYPVIQNKTSNELYYVIQDSFLNKLKELKELEMLKKAITKYGYSVNEKNQVKTKLTKVRLTSWLIEELEKNPDYLKELDSKCSQIYELTKLYPAYIKTLDKYLGLYRIQLKMSTNDINAWRAATEKANATFRKVYELQEKYNIDASDINESKERSEMLEDFIDNLSVSRSILGI